MECEFGLKGNHIKKGEGEDHPLLVKGSVGCNGVKVELGSREQTCSQLKGITYLGFFKTQAVVRDSDEPLAKH